MEESRDYNETLSSSKTHALFVTLSILFLIFFLCRWPNVGLDGWAITFLCFFAFFLFYVFNYHTINIRITSETLQLTFGIIAWKIAISNIKSCYIDEDTIWRFGGAGIHFMFIKGKYRAFFNFLEHPRVVVTLKKKKGPVREIAFSTRHPEQVREFINRYSS